MTPKQIERIQNKIKKIRSTLVAEKRKYGGYDDSRGLRYVPPKHFIQIADYTGGLTYLKWFHKNFPDDSGFPDFLFDWTIVLFKTGKINEAEKKALETFCRNTYLFDKFFNKDITPIDKHEGSNLECPQFVHNLEYTATQPELLDFSNWLQEYISTTYFREQAGKYIDIMIKLKTENDSKKRGILLREAYKIKGYEET